MKCRTSLRVFAGQFALLLAWWAIPAAAGETVPDFSFLHTSDNHLTPQPVGRPPPGPGNRTYDGLQWFFAEAQKPQEIGPLNLRLPPPSFVIDTGDVTEYGVIHTTWDNFEALARPVGSRLFVVPGNHDNTWTGMCRIMRRRYGGDHYSFDRFGCHFVGIDTATPQEPLPSLEQRTLTWLAADLKRVPRSVPVFLFGHHPLSGTEFAPFEPLRLLALLEEHNVVLYMMGHGHGHRHERWNDLDSVMGGTTSHPVERAGYNIVFVKAGILRVAFRPRDPAKPVEITLEKPVTPRPRPEVTFLSPRPASPNGSTVPLTGRDLPVRLHVNGGRPTRVTAGLNADKDRSVQLTPSRAGVFEGKLATGGLLPGRHFVLVTAEFGDQKIDRAEEVLLAPADSPAAVRTLLESGVKAQPMVLGNDVLVATTAGELVRLSFTRRKPTVRTIYDAGVEILHPPAIVEDRLFVSAAEKGVQCLTTDGRVVWACSVGAVVYGTPAVGPDRVYVADMEGAVHAIDRQTGKLVWSQRHASYSVEMPVLLHTGALYFGAWDGQVYAVNVKDGSLKWKQNGPAGQSSDPKLKSRYYAPADCPVLMIGNRLFVTDRAYRLGSYNAETGEYLGEIASDISAIGAAADRKSFYARGLAKGLTRYDARGKPMWTLADLPLGRFPAAPVEVAGRVFVCSNEGTLSVHDAAMGRVMMAYQATPHLHVMAPVAGDASGAAYVAGMDGSLTRVQPPRID